MKKSFLVCLVTVAVTASALVVTGCDINEEPQTGWGYEYNLSTAYVAAVEKGYGGTLEEFIESISGKDGKDGMNGENGKDGADGEKGENGENGKSAYEIWLDNGYEGTEEDFLEWLKADAPLCEHAYSDWSVILQPTCTAGGAEERTCENCGAKEYRFTQAKGHGTGNSFDYYDNNDLTYHYAVCSDCSVIYREEHVYLNHRCIKCNASEYVPPVVNPHYFVGYNGIYTNGATGFIYRYKGMDFYASEGDNVYTMAEGVVESISLSRETGNIITINHGNGLKTRYRFVEPVEGLNERDRVRRGEVIATVAAAYGTEKADGPHLYFEVELNGELVDPIDYFDAVYEPIEKSDEESIEEQ